MGRKLDRASRVNRPYVRQRRAPRGNSSPAALASTAGLTQRPSIEQLERRQMLFSLAVTANDVNPNTGIGTVRAFFGYTIPYLNTSITVPTGQTDTVVTAAFGQLPYGDVGSGSFFAGTGIRTVHSISPPDDYRIAGNPQTNDNQNRFLFVRQDQVGEFFTFEFWSPQENPTIRTEVRTATVTIAANGPGDNSGLLTDNVTAELLDINQNVIASFTGAALRALIQGGTPAQGIGTFTFNAPANAAAFHAIRFRLNTAPGTGVDPAFEVTGLSYTIPAGVFKPLIDSRIFGAEAVLSGPVGATATFSDLYGRDMEQTIDLGAPPPSTLDFVDRNDDGVPDFNDGIGAIHFTGTDSRTAFTLWGGKIVAATTPPTDADFYDGQFAFTIADSNGLYDDMESAGFAFTYDVTQGQVRLTGLPPGPGSVVVGSPFVRDNTTGGFNGTYNPTGAVPGQANPVISGFNNASQGLFIDDGAPIGSIYIAGILSGSSRFTNFVDRIYVGYLLGSIDVEGDLGSLVVGTDAGQWSPDPNFTVTNPNLRLDANNKTFAQLVVGRTVGSIDIAGRSLLDVTVVGNLNDPVNHPARDVFDYYEQEFVYGINPTANVLAVNRATLTDTGFVARQPDDLFRTVDQGMVFGTGYMRNDTLMGAEWVGSISSGVRIKGDLSGRDPLNGEDADDVYAFAADGTQEITIEGTNDSTTTAPFFRVVDEFGRTLASPQLPGTSGRFQATQLHFKPTEPGVYYVIITDPNGAVETNFGLTEYTLAITGMATATLGEYRTGGGSGFTDINSGEGNSVTVLSGNVGTLRIGTGLSTAGGEIAPIAAYNTVQTADDSMSFQGGTFIIPGNLYNITAGGDIGNPGAIGGGSPINIHVGGNFGSLLTGLSTVVGGGPRQGDLNFFSLTVGGSIASIQVSGGIGMDQDDTGDPRAPVLGQVVFTTGTAGGPGNIGLIRVGFHVAGDELSIRTSPGSIVGAFLVSQDSYNDTDPRSGIYLGLQGVSIFTGAGSDVRFVDTPRIDLRNSVDVFTPLIGGQTAHFIDDDGSAVDITVDNAPPGIQVGTVRLLPISGSQGNAIAQISVDLTGGAVLHISGVNASSGGVISIGHIIVTASDAASAILIDGPVKTDVYNIQSAGGLNDISNNSPGGDLVSVDVAALNTISVSGDLGRTQVPAWGPQLIGLQLGLAASLNGAVGGPLGMPLTAGVTVDNDFDGTIFRAPTDERVSAGQAALDDIGSPLDGQLNGLVVRTGSLANVTVKGAVGDVILEDAAGTLAALTANSDNVTAQGGFDGIIGNIFANNIGNIDVGDGLAAPGPGPMATTGIVAINDIASVTSSKTSGVVISGVINALNNTPDVATNPAAQDGIGRVALTNGSFVDARIASEFLDGFWVSFNFTDDNVKTGNIAEIDLTNTGLFRTDITGINLGSLNMTGANGIFDASTVRMTGAIDTITAQSFQNSTVAANASELHDNFIESARDVNKITSTGDMSDLVIDITGRVTDSISAVNISRSTIDVDNEIHSLVASNDIRGSTITAGSTPSITAGRDIQSSTFNIAGVVNTITAADHIGNSSINVTGSGGSIGTITARSYITGSIAASGPIGTISVTAGDLAASITTTGSNGNVGTLSASGNLDINTDVSGSISALVAGGNIGSPTDANVILVRGDLANATATGGQLFSDLRVGGTITGAVTLGGAVAKPGNDQVGHGSIVAFNRIASVIVNGDFDGDIISYTGGIGSVVINNGSFRAGNTIAAYDGSLTSVAINNGNLYGNVHADYNITLLKVSGLADGIFGDVGVSSNRSGTVSYDSKRNQLPPGVAAASGYQGPTISAGQNIVSIIVSGSAYETQFVAGRAINAIAISGSVANDSQSVGFGSLFAAGDSIDNITIGNGVNNTQFIAGIVSLGSDGRAGGVGDAADTVKSGNIGTVTVAHGMFNGAFSAGIAAGADGVYNTADDLSVLGISKINTLNLTGTLTTVSAFGDQLSSSVNGNSHITKGGTNLPSTNPQLDTGAGTPGTAFTGTHVFNNVNGANVTIAFAGAGQAFFDTATSTLTLRNTNSTSNVTISSSTGTLNNFDLFTNDDASLGTLRFQGVVTGDSDLVVDGNITTLTYGDVSGTGSMSVGGDVGAATFTSLTGGFFSARTVQTLHVNGQFGNANSTVLNEASISLLSGGAIAITGGASALISVDRDLSSLTINGFVDRSSFRFGNSLGTLTVPNLSRTVLSAGDTLGAITIGGDVLQSTISAGADLGTDGLPGGTGSAADTLSTGFIGNVAIAGNFSQSSLTAGYLRGADGYFGTSDDSVAAGRSTIGTITIGGTQVGSSRNSESYRIASSGTVGLVKIGGSPFTGSQGNFALETPLLAPLSVQVKDIQVTVDSRISTANIIFNQPMNASTLSAALSVSEVRGTGDIAIRLVEGIDFTLSYNAATNTAAVTFSDAVTSRNLPAVPGEPGPGVYRFEFEQSILRAKLSGVLLDGNGDGFATPGDNFSSDTIVGDAGDKVTAETDFVGTNNSQRVDLYAPDNLNIVMDNNQRSDGLPDPNTTYTIRGFIGDNPDNDSNFFRFGGDVDLYSITLQAGQILRLGALQGSALQAPVTLNDANGNAVGGIGADADVVALPATPAGINDQTFETDYLVLQTGTYIISVGNSQDINVPGVVSNPNPPPGGLGDYNFTVQVFDDGNSGFSDTTDAGNGSNIVNAPAPIAFAGSDAIFGTADDLSQIVVGNFTFTLNKGPDGRFNTADDLVTGSDGNGIVSTRDGTGRMETDITSAIGPTGHIGAPSVVAADVDIYHLNDRNPIAPGTRMTVTVKLADLGADLGSAAPTSGGDNRGAVQFGIFDTSDSTNITDANLVFSPTDFTPNGGKPNTVIADNGSTKYGYDANGDFYITFLAPDRQGAPGSSGTFAVYLQGTNNTDYQLQVVTDGTSGTSTTQRQNILIETNGGSVNWLQAGGLTTNLGSFDARTLGFSGSIAGLNVQTYILNNLVAALNGLFQSAGAGGSGFDVHFSTNPSDFEFQPFSTIFLTSTSDPVTPLFDPFDAFNLGLFGGNQFNNTQPYGASQHSDPLNADLEDEAVVFVPSFALQGLTPGQADVNLFVQSLTAAVGRRAGELMGLRVTDPNSVGAGANFDFMAANSVDNQPGPGRAYSLIGNGRTLSDPFDSVNRTDFFLGSQNARSLLDKILSQS